MRQHPFDASARRSWPDDGYGIKDARATAIKPNEQHAVDPTQMQSTAWRTLPKNVELMSQYQDFGLPAAVAT
jgi:hypothetical protein